MVVAAQKAVIKDGDKYLVIRRSHESQIYPGHWDMPGGKVEEAEDLKQSLEREIMEETGLKANVLNPVFTFHEFNNHHWVVLILYQCEIVSGDIKLSHEHTKYKWATKDEILCFDKVEPYLNAFLTSR